MSNEVKMATKPSLDKAMQFLTKGGFIKQLATGTATGWVSGMTAGLAGKSIALAAGTSVILFEIAQNKGITKSDWNSLKEYATCKAQMVTTGQAGNTVSKVRAFASKNKSFTAGFVGGFLLGIAF